MKKVERDEFRKLIENRWAGGFLEKLEQHNALALLDALDRAEDVLQYYADETNYEPPGGTHYCESAVETDDKCGSRARELLAKWEGK